MTAGPSRSGVLPDPGPDERAPLDLLDEDYRPPEDYVPNTKTRLRCLGMNDSIRTRYKLCFMPLTLRATLPSKPFQPFDETWLMCRLELAIRKYPNHIRHPRWVRDQSASCEALAKEFNDLPWDE